MIRLEGSHGQIKFQCFGKKTMTETHQNLHNRLFYGVQKNMRDGIQYLNDDPTCSFDIFSKTEINLLGDKFLPVIIHGFLRSDKNVNHNNCPTLDGLWMLVYPVILWAL